MKFHHQNQKPALVVLKPLALLIPAAAAMVLEASPTTAASADSINASRPLTEPTT